MKRCRCPRHTRCALGQFKTGPLRNHLVTIKRGDGKVSKELKFEELMQVDARVAFPVAKSFVAPCPANRKEKDRKWGVPATGKARAPKSAATEKSCGHGNKKACSDQQGAQSTLGAVNRASQEGAGLKWNTERGRAWR